MLTPKGGSSDRMLEPLSGMSESGGHLEFGQDRKATASAEGRGTTGDVPLLRWPDKPICLPKCGYGTAWQTVHSEGRRIDDRSLFCDHDYRSLSDSLRRDH